MTQLITSIHIGAGFWLHITWNTKGTIGIDQHGTAWFNKQNPVSEYGLKAQPEKKKTGWLSADDLFLQQRESYHEYFHSRSALINK